MNPRFALLLTIAFTLALADRAFGEAQHRSGLRGNPALSPNLKHPDILNNVAASTRNSAPRFPSTPSSTMKPEIPSSSATSSHVPSSSRFVYYNCPMLCTIV